MLNSISNDDSFMTEDHNNQNFFISKEIEAPNPTYSNVFQDELEPIQTIISNNINQQSNDKILNIFEQKNEIATKLNTYIHDDHENTNNITTKNDNYENFDIGSSDESTSDSANDINDIFIPQFFVETVSKTAEQHLNHTENTENPLNGHFTTIPKIKQTQSISRNAESEFQIIHMVAKPANTDSITAICLEEKRQIEEIMKDAKQSFEKVKKYEQHKIEEATEKVLKTIEKVRDETLSQIEKNRRDDNEIQLIKNSSQVAIQKVKEDGFSQILKAKEEALTKVKLAKNVTIDRIQRARDCALKKLKSFCEISMNDQIELKSRNVGGFEEFGIGSSDASASDEENEASEGFFVPESFVEMIHDAAEKQLNSLGKF